MKRLFLLSLAIGLSGCASVPGKTRVDQVETIDALVERTLVDLEKQEPGALAALNSSVGYVVMNNKITKVPVFGVGSGYGVAVRTDRGERTYLRMGRFDIGGGWGARSVRPVLIFRDLKKFDEFIDGKWSAHFGAEATAKAGEEGVAGGAGVGERMDTGYSVHLITDVGVSATVTAGLIRVKPLKLKKANERYDH